MNSLSSLLSPLNNINPTSIFKSHTIPDKAVASQVLMYRQILHTECKPGLRLSRNYEGTDAQRKVKHMPWWEQGVESSRKMVISYNNLIVRLWLNGAIMPFVDGGYASDFVGVSVPKDDEDGNDNNDDNNSKNNGDDDNRSETTNTPTNHIDTLIDSNGLPPIPHHYWVDRLGFQQTDPVTDFRSGGVLSLAMLVHIVESCPNVHARFLPSGDTHMLPFGITCINITDMIAKFCMFSKAIESMDALLSQKPFWKMFGDPNCLLVLQELSMEVLCNVVVEMGRERKMVKLVESAREENNNGNGDGDGASSRFSGQDDTDKVTVFDFAEILAKTEKRVNDDLLGAGPKSVDDLRAIHTRNFTKYMKALERKEQQAQRQYERALQRNNSSNVGSTDNSINNNDSSNNNNDNIAPKLDEDFMKSVEEAKKATKIMTENMIGSAGGVFNKFKSFGFASPNNNKNNDSDNKQQQEKVTEEIDFALPKSASRSSDDNNENTLNTKIDLFDMSDAPAPPVIEASTPNANIDLFDMSDAPVPPTFEKSTDVDTSIDELFNEFDTSTSSVKFTIDDDDDDFL